jgi:hypothetical protein
VVIEDLGTVWLLPAGFKGPVTPQVWLHPAAIVRLSFFLCFTRFRSGGEHGWCGGGGGGLREMEEGGGGGVVGSRVMAEEFSWSSLNGEWGNQWVKGLFLWGMGKTSGPIN